MDNKNIKLTILHEDNPQPVDVTINIAPVIIKCMTDYQDILKKYKSWRYGLVDISFEHRTLSMQIVVTYNSRSILGVGALREGWTQKIADKLNSIIQTGNYKANIIMEVSQQHNPDRLEPYFKHIIFEEIKEGGDANV